MTQSPVSSIVTPSEESCSFHELLEAKVHYNRFHSMLLVEKCIKKQQQGHYKEKWGK